MEVQQPGDPAGDRLLTPEEVCDRLGVTKRWLRRQLEKGLLDAVKVGKHNRFREAYINGIVANGLPLDD
jgi:excisionase family DNA binding protein